MVYLRSKPHSAMHKTELQALRRQYSLSELDESMVAADPMTQFSRWLQEAVHARLPEPNAMVLATVNASGQPTTRTVLLKEIRTDGFIFYTNYESRKGRELDINPLTSLHFLWLELERQVRIEGVAHRLLYEDSEAYFRSRPRESQIGAWASRQSEPILSRVILEKRFRELEEKYTGEESLPLPPFWGGYLVRPSRLEFWQGRANRLHDRILYSAIDGGQWETQRLQP